MSKPDGFNWKRRDFFFGVFGLGEFGKEGEVLEEQVADVFFRELRELGFWGLTDFYKKSDNLPSISYKIWSCQKGWAVDICWH